MFFPGRSWPNCTRCPTMLRSDRVRFGRDVRRQSGSWRKPGVGSGPGATPHTASTAWTARRSSATRNTADHPATRTTSQSFSHIKDQFCFKRVRPLQFIYLSYELMRQEMSHIGILKKVEKCGFFNFLSLFSESAD